MFKRISIVSLAICLFIVGVVIYFRVKNVEQEPTTPSKQINVSKFQDMYKVNLDNKDLKVYIIDLETPKEILMPLSRTLYDSYNTKLTEYMRNIDPTFTDAITELGVVSEAMRATKLIVVTDSNDKFISGGVLDLKKNYLTAPKEFQKTVCLLSFEVTESDDPKDYFKEFSSIYDMLIRDGKELMVRVVTDLPSEKLESESERTEIISAFGEGFYLLEELPQEGIGIPAVESRIKEANALFYFSAEKGGALYKGNEAIGDMVNDQVLYSIDFSKENNSGTLFFSEGVRTNVSVNLEEYGYNSFETYARKNIGYQIDELSYDQTKAAYEKIKEEYNIYQSKSNYGIEVVQNVPGQFDDNTDIEKLLESGKAISFYANGVKSDENFRKYVEGFENSYSFEESRAVMFIKTK